VPGAARPERQGYLNRKRWGRGNISGIQCLCFNVLKMLDGGFPLGTKHEGVNLDSEIMMIVAKWCTMSVDLTPRQTCTTPGLHPPSGETLSTPLAHSCLSCHKRELEPRLLIYLHSGSTRGVLPSYTTGLPRFLRISF